MFKVNWSNIHGQNGGGTFDTIEEAQAWVDDCIEKNIWGKKEKTEYPCKLENCIVDYSKDCATCEHSEKVVTPCEYQIEITPYKKPYDESRREEYQKEGLTIEALTIALVEKIGENRPESFDALMVKRNEIKAKYPKK